MMRPCTTLTNVHPASLLPTTHTAPPQDPEARNVGDNTPLHYACLNGHTEVRGCDGSVRGLPAPA